MIKSLTPYFNNYIDEWADAKERQSVGQSKLISKSRETLTDLFIAHYATVIRSIRDFESKSATRDFVASAVSSSQIDKYINRAQSEANGLLDRLDQLLDQTLKDEKEKPDIKRRRGNIFARVVGKAKDRMKRRIPFIANMNTNGIAEETRLLIVSQGHGGALTATWVTRQDEKVREAHRLVHGQTRTMDEPFDVGGEKMRFPGDFSLGASLGNIINCRCKLVFHLDGKPIGETPSLDPRTTDNTKPVPTRSITLAANARARVVLGDGATLGTVIREGNKVRVVVNRRTVARAKIRGNQLVDIRVDDESDSLGIAQLLRNSTPL